MRKKSILMIACGIAVLSLSSCDVLFDSVLDSAFESKRDRNIREDSANLSDGKPLEHYTTERRLKVDRENRMYEDLRSGS